LSATGRDGQLSVLPRRQIHEIAQIALRHAHCSYSVRGVGLVTQAGRPRKHNRKDQIMFIHKFVRGSVALALVLTAGSALASPARGYRDALVVSESAQASGTSYRDSAARLEVKESNVASNGYRDRFAHGQVTARQTALTESGAWH
jgi:hypothetical protein